jgi:hypothetical protein
VCGQRGSKASATDLNSAQLRAFDFILNSSAKTENQPNSKDKTQNLRILPLFERFWGWIVSIACHLSTCCQNSGAPEPAFVPELPKLVETRSFQSRRVSLSLARAFGIFFVH